VLTGMPAGQYGPAGYEEGSLLNLAVNEAREYWRKTLASPDKLTRLADEQQRDEEDWTGTRVDPS